jgi:hypothetical protein
VVTDVGVVEQHIDGDALQVVSSFDQWVRQ